MLCSTNKVLSRTYNVFKRFRKNNRNNRLKWNSTRTPGTKSFLAVAGHHCTKQNVYIILLSFSCSIFFDVIWQLFIIFIYILLISRQHTEKKPILLYTPNNFLDIFVVNHFSHFRYIIRTNIYLPIVNSLLPVFNYYSSTNVYYYHYEIFN